MRLLRASALLAIGLLVQVWVDRAVAPPEQRDDQLLATQPEAAPHALVPVTLRQSPPATEIASPRRTPLEASSVTSPAQPANHQPARGADDHEDRYAIGTAGVTIARRPAARSRVRAVTVRTRSAVQPPDASPVLPGNDVPDPAALDTSAGAPTLALIDALPSPIRQRRVAYRSEPAPLGAESLPLPAAPAPSGRPQHHDMITIRRVIQEYATAFGRLDPGAAKRVWPTLDEQALARAFNGLQSQSLTLDDCGVTITGAIAAQASCHGRATYLPKVGRQRPFSTTGEWRFSLARAGSAWVIQSAAVQ